MPNLLKNGTGRRKSAVARVYLSTGKGNITINGKDFRQYLCRETLANVVLEPLEAIDKVQAYDFSVNVKGGGLTGQAGAIRLGIARALLEENIDYRTLLKSAGFLKRDSRKVERKKYGQPGARKKFQFSTRYDSMSEVSFENLLSTGAHFGHVTRKWHPAYEPFILMERNGVHIINLEETLSGLKKAQDFLTQVIKKNGEVLFVGTKKQAKDIVQQEADRCGMFYVVERWLGGTLTNFSTIKKSIKRLQMLEKEGSSIYEDLTKKEIQMLNRERVKLADQHRGIKDMRRVPDALVVVDPNFESTAVQEALRLEIPVIAIVDSNTDPSVVSHVIPANDDSIRTIQLILSAITDTILSAQVKDVDKKIEKEKVAPNKDVKKSKVSDDGQAMLDNKVKKNKNIDKNNDSNNIENDKNPSKESEKKE